MAKKPTGPAIDLSKLAAQMPRVVIAVPSSDSMGMKVQTANAIGCNIIYATGLVSNFFTRQSCDIVSNRTWLVKEAIEKGATHIFFVDCDMFFPADTLVKLLAHRKEIVGVEYNKRSFPLEGLALPIDGTEASKTDLYKVKSTGMGVMLIDLSVFKKIGTPWFNFGRDKEGKLVLGEDVWFINTARDAGIDTWVDPTIKVGHLGEFCY